MPTSSAVREFIESLPDRELFIAKLLELSERAGRLAHSERQLAAQFILIRIWFTRLADHWDADEPLEASVSQELTPLVNKAVRDALEQPGPDTTLELDGVMAAACARPAHGPLQPWTGPFPWHQE